MIVTCEKCQKRYLVQDEQVGENGRKVRCIACGYQWFQTPLMPNSITNSMEKDLPSINLTPQQMNLSSASWGWTLFIFTSLFVLSSLYFGRNVIVSAWPKASALYKSFGIEVTTVGSALKIVNVRPS